jgi:hypothetical protein
MDKKKGRFQINQKNLLKCDLNQGELMYFQTVLEGQLTLDLFREAKTG